jgi:hypothetical protein
VTPIQGAKVEAKNAQTKIAYSTISFGSGDYPISNLPPGQCSIIVTMQGMKAYAHAYVLVQSEAYVPEDVALEVQSDLRGC